MPLVNIKTSDKMELDLEKIYSSVMKIFGTPPTGVQIFHENGIAMYPRGIFVDMRIKSKVERDGQWMDAAMAEVALAVGGDKADDVRVRCEMFEDPKLFKNF